jgi:hypothetical protein
MSTVYNTLHDQTAFRWVETGDQKLALGLFLPKDVAPMYIQFYDDAGHVTSPQDDSGQYLTKALTALHQLKTTGFWCGPNEALRQIHKEQTHAA